jgi:hypothetical protein
MIKSFDTSFFLLPLYSIFYYFGPCLVGLFPDIKMGNTPFPVFLIDPPSPL